MIRIKICGFALIFLHRRVHACLGCVLTDPRQFQIQMVLYYLWKIDDFLRRRVVVMLVINYHWNFKHGLVKAKENELSGSGRSNSCSKVSVFSQVYSSC